MVGMLQSLDKYSSLPNEYGLSQVQPYEFEGIGVEVQELRAHYCCEF